VLVGEDRLQRRGDQQVAPLQPATGTVEIQDARAFARRQAVE
jgi:hypothetical protein